MGIAAGVGSTGERVANSVCKSIGPSAAGRLVARESTSFTGGVGDGSTISGVVEAIGCVWDLPDVKAFWVTK
ncbi:MAG: hypothetical protein R3C99_12200 [Pirellulaceae bacterium]